MKVQEAKDLVLRLIEQDIHRYNAPIQVNSSLTNSRDPGKFLLAGLPARVIHRFSGWHIPIRLEWFRGASPLPQINREEFYWYVLAIPQFVCG